MYTCSQARRKLPYLHRLQKSEQLDQDRHFSYPKKGMAESTKLEEQ